VIHFARELAADKSGVTTVEYGLLAAILATILIATVPAIGSGLSNALRIVASSLHGKSPTTGSAPG
jgi:Flp pilus assembly pilin Flp